MESELIGAVTLSLSKASCLILFELLTASYEGGAKTIPTTHLLKRCWSTRRRGHSEQHCGNWKEAWNEHCQSFFPATMLIFLQRRGACLANESGDRV